MEGVMERWREGEGRQEERRKEGWVTRRGDMEGVMERWREGDGRGEEMEGGMGDKEGRHGRSDGEMEGGGRKTRGDGRRDG